MTSGQDRTEQKHAYHVLVWGKVYTYCLSPKDLVKIIADRIVGEQDNSYMDGCRDEPITLEELQKWTYDECVNCKEMEVYVDGLSFSMPTPKEIRFISKAGIYDIAKQSYNEMYGEGVA